MSKFKTGDKVRYTGSGHEREPEWYPPVGTIGEIIENTDETSCYIQWPKGSTSKNDCWYCDENDIELVENVDMTNEEIWEMIEHKMQKNGLKKKMGALYCGNTLTNGYWVYTLDDAHNAIALAYKVGYLRAMKGRPFKFGEKKKKNGHWVPVDPENLPKEGTRVRYSRRNKALDCWIQLNEHGIIRMKDGWFGMEIDDPKGHLEWVCFDKIANCLDMWVEDDE